ncbi:MAG: ATP-dependent Clp protease ATP-binding subunit, partial [Chloroflexota bacterium]
EELTEITESHLLLALLQEGEGVAVRKLIEMDFDLNLWLQRLLLEAQEEEDLDSDNLFGDPFNDFDFDSSEFDFSDDSEDSDRPAPTPLLDKYGRDLIEAARNGRIGSAVARDKEIRAVARTLSRSKKNNPLLLGDAGVGKTAVVEGLAYAIHSGKAPQSLLEKRIVEIEIGTLVAGTSLRGQFEERLLGIVNEVNRAGNVILFIDEIHTIVGAGDTIDSNLDAANILKPALARGDLNCIGATTHEEYQKAIAADPALERRFRTIDIDEPTTDSTMMILEGQRMRLESHHDVTLPEETLRAAVDLSVRYLPDRRLPDKAIDLLDEACTRVVIRTNMSDQPGTDGDDGMEDIGRVRPTDVANVLSDWTGIPVSDMTQEDKERLADLDQLLKERVKGQDEAVEALAAIIKSSRAGLGDPNRPVGVFLFLGPSGVGKTELAATLADTLFGSEDAMLRLDMSEFHDSHTVARLIGAPPGYRDSKRGGQLTDGLRRRPYSVVLLDEVEKAAPEVFDIFLQVFDEGRVSDANGRPVDARHAVFIMTSNIGTQEANKQIGFGNLSRESKQDYASYLGQFFRPEFLNRLDEILTFNALTEDTLSAILDLQLAEVHERLNQQGVMLHLTDEARAVILREGYDPDNGARPLRRTIERLIVRPLSDKLLRSEFAPGDRVIGRPAADHTLTFNVESPI